MNKITMGIAIGLLSTIMQLWHPVKGYSEYFVDNQRYCNDPCYFFRPFLDYLVFDGGYRWDKVIEIQTADGIEFDSTTKIFENISSIQFGAKGAISMCSNWYLRGAGHYGLLVDGLYDTALSYSHVRGHTWDACGAIGYLFNCYNSLGIAPVVGYSYDKHHFAVTSFVSEFVDITGNAARRAKADFKWYGPFVGLDFVFNSCNWAFDAGYELHFGHAKERFYNIPSNAVNTQSFGHHGTNKHMIGHVWRLDGLHPIGCGWIFGFGLKYTYWNNQIRSSVSLDPGANEGTFEGTSFHDDRLQWHSFAATLNLGYTF